MPTRSPKHVPNPASPAPVHQFCRPSSNHTYDAKWRGFREAHSHIVPPICVVCGYAGCAGDKSMHLDHITPIASGGEQYEVKNLQWLCISCHSRKTAREDGGFGRQRNA